MIKKVLGSLILHEIKEKIAKNDEDQETLLNYEKEKNKLNEIISSLNQNEELNQKQIKELTFPH